VGLGSNLGDGPATLAAARAALEALPGFAVAAASSIYLTEPQGFRPQPFFSNQVLQLACDGAMRAHSLLDALLAAELSLGRERKAISPGGSSVGEDSALRFGPRTIDLDLLLFGNEVMTGERLTLPHPRMLERAFVLVPLAEIAPDLVLPQGGMRVRDALRRLRYRQCGQVLYQTQ
jgi:2-amino-4-hydroxy-6-hydroxymethyldihydropteridine diphosphokinase